MVSSSEFLMETLARKAKVESRALGALRYVATTVSVSPLYEYACYPRRLEPIPWEHIPYRLEAMPNESRVITTKPFGLF